ncbi:MAG: hypothetical protein LBL20_03985 [Treponema sp.]|jgi:hypothetical protein|nr:hypothetical protein [Treponema sp.]
MYAIKAEFDGTKITPKEPVPVTGPYEAIVTFTKPAEREEPAKRAKKSLDYLDEFYGCFRENSPWEGGSVEIIRKIRDEW